MPGRARGRALSDAHLSHQQLCFTDPAWSDSGHGPQVHAGASPTYTSSQHLILLWSSFRTLHPGALTEIKCRQRAQTRGRGCMPTPRITFLRSQPLWTTGQHCTIHETTNMTPIRRLFSYSSVTVCWSRKARRKTPPSFALLSRWHHLPRSDSKESRSRRRDTEIW